MKNFSGKTRGTVAGIFATIMAVALVAAWSWTEYKKSHRPKAASPVYELTVRDTRGKWMGLLCYESPKGNEYEFSINRMDKAFAEVKLTGDRAINTRNPVLCNAYPYEEFDVGERLKALGVKGKLEKRLFVIGDGWAYGETLPLGGGFPDKMQSFSGYGAVGLVKSWRVVNLARPGILVPEIYDRAFKGALGAGADSVLFAWSMKSMPSAWRGGMGKPQKFFVPDKLDARSAEMLGKYAEMMSIESKAAGVSFSVAILPVYNDASRDLGKLKSIHAAVAHIFKSKGVEVFDLTEPLVPLIEEAGREGGAGPVAGAGTQFRAAVELAGKLKITEKPIDVSKYGVRRVEVKEFENTGERVHVPVVEWFSKCVFVFTFALFVALVIGGLLSTPEMLGLIIKEKKILLLSCAAVAAAAFAARHYISPHAHLTFLDEFDRYRIISQWMRGKFAANTTDNIPGSMLPYYVAYKIFGMSPEVGFRVTIAAACGSVMLMYASARMMLRRGWFALAAAAMLAVSPLHLRYSASHTIDIINVFFLLAALFAVLLEMKRPSWRTTIFCAAACSFALFTRVENVLFVAMLLAARGAVVKHSGMKRGDVHPVLFTGMMTAPMAVACLYVAVCLKLTPQGAHVSHALENIARNLPGNIEFFYRNGAMPVVVSALSALGAVGAFRTGADELRAPFHKLLLAWFVAAFVLHLMSAAGGYDSSKFRDTSRYAIQLLPAMLLFAAAGAAFVWDALPDAARMPVVAPVVAFALLAPPNFSSWIDSKSEFMTINEIVLKTAARYDADVRFDTNSMLVRDILELDGGRLGPDNDCARINVFYTRDMAVDLYPYSMKCDYRFVVGPGNLYFCRGRRDRGEMPDKAWVDPDANLVTGVR